MHRTISILLAALLLMGLAGCTNEDKTTGEGTDTQQERRSMEGYDAYAGDWSDGTDDTFGTSFQQMLENARVHDSDGILTDGENSVS